jgi:gamma-glutamyltranspeptidase/glutathione hydrolase
MKRATVDKDRHVGDPKFVDAPGPADRQGARGHARRRDPCVSKSGRAALNLGGRPSRDTTHVSVIDGEGSL